MKHFCKHLCKHRLRIVLTMALLMSALVVVLLAIRPGNATALFNGSGYTLDWWTVDGGGGTWSDAGGQYELNGTSGQPDAGVWSDDDYTLTGGFWSSGEVEYSAYLPLVLKD